MITNPEEDSDKHDEEFADTDNENKDDRVVESNNEVSAKNQTAIDHSESNIGITSSAESDVGDESEFEDEPLEKRYPQLAETNLNSNRIKTPLSVVIAAIVLTLLTVVCLQVDDWGRDWTQNTAETSPDAKDELLRPLESKLSPTELAKLVAETLADSSRWEVIEAFYSDELATLHLVHSTRFLKFKDDVNVEIVKSEAGSTMHVKSQSRIGKGDLGQNPRNIRDLITRIQDALQDMPPN